MSVLMLMFAVTAHAAPMTPAQAQLVAAAEWTQARSAEHPMESYEMLDVEMTLRERLAQTPDAEELLDLPVPGSTCSLDALQDSPSANLTKAAELMATSSAPLAANAASELWLGRAVATTAEEEGTGYKMAKVQAYAAWKFSEAVMLQDDSAQVAAATRLAAQATQDLAEQACKE